MGSEGGPVSSPVEARGFCPNAPTGGWVSPRLSYSEGLGPGSRGALRASSLLLWSAGPRSPVLWAEGRRTLGLSLSWAKHSSPPPPQETRKRGGVCLREVPVPHPDWGGIPSSPIVAREDGCGLPSPFSPASSEPGSAALSGACRWLVALEALAVGVWGVSPPLAQRHGFLIGELFSLRGAALPLGAVEALPAGVGEKAFGLGRGLPFGPPRADAGLTRVGWRIPNSVPRGS